MLSMYLGAERKGHKMKEVMLVTAENATDDFKAMLIRITDGFVSDLRELSVDNGSADLRKALRAFIDVLEDIYRQL